MKKVLAVIAGLLLVLGLSGYLLVSNLTSQLWPAQPSVALATEPSCSMDGFAQLPDVRLSSVSRSSTNAEHCRVSGIIEKEIRFDLLLPQAWNGKFVMGGGGGFVGSVINMAAMYGALQSGYATVGTDTGHSAHSQDASWALDNPERIENFGHRSVHLTAVTAKKLIRSYYGQAIARNYFLGCSRGGGQGLMEAQRYPEDFDGIVAGAPAYNWTVGIGANATQIARAMFPDPANLDEAVIRPEDQALIAQRYLEQCDALDGIEDRILQDPRTCPFKLESLRCENDDSVDCLSDAKIAAMRTIYGGPRNTDGKLFPGYPLGGELSEGGMSAWLTGGLRHNGRKAGDTDDNGNPVPVIPNLMFGFGNGVMKHMVFNDPNWSYASYDYDNFLRDSAAMEKVLNATNPDLDAFRDRGGKLLMYHGWSDTALSALATIEYYETVTERDPSASDDMILYLLPGVDHCIGGEGPSLVNYLTEIDKWVESGDAPGELKAQWLHWMLLPWGSRLVCPYPQQLKYDGAGSTSDSGSFSCVSPGT